MSGTSEAAVIWTDPNRYRRRKRKFILLAVALILALAVTCANPSLLDWFRSVDRAGGDLSHDQALEVLADHEAPIEDRRRALHRLNRTLQSTIEAIRNAAADPELASHVAEHFRAFQRQMDEVK